MKLYVYCLTEGIDSLSGPIRGISGAPVRLDKIEELGLMVSEFNDETVPVTHENAMDHAAVVRSVLDRTTPLPFRFGTLVTEQQLRSYVAARKSALETNLSLVRGCVEMSVKIIWQVAMDQEEEPRKPVQGIGATFLAAKRSEILGSELRAAKAREISIWLHESVKGLTRGEKVSIQPLEKLFLTAAHLVGRDNLKQYRRKMVQARDERRDLHFLLSGPWPPYSFANIELDVKTQFGVS
ncbi:MAG TPA: GvpL/GvpF family gas vesicle protein [Pyrinomonadaceae bacterium]|nr:GvpL/GvpF family gas vesicle protein [Pyrinomonadaceae bacterium]